MYYCSEAVKYLPDFEDLVSFEDCAGKGLKKQCEGDDDSGLGASGRDFILYVYCMYC